VPVILLGGRSWRVLDVDWTRRTVSVEPAAEQGRSRWFGSSRALHAELAHSVERVLATGESGVTLSTRAQVSLAKLREEMPYLDGESLPLVSSGDEVRIWTFSGSRANAMLASELRSNGCTPRSVDNFGVTLRHMDKKTLDDALDSVSEEDCRVPVDTRMVAKLKFGACLPEKLAHDVLCRRLSDFVPYIIACSARDGGSTTGLLRVSEVNQGSEALWLAPPRAASFIKLKHHSAANRWRRLVWPWALVVGRICQICGLCGCPDGRAVA
jgi:hypothetical protein